MGKAYCAIISALAFIGAAAAGYLTYLHYYPAADAKFVLCGGEFAGNCDALSQWEYASVFGLPIAAYGLFVFLVILFTMLIADYAAGVYYFYGLAIIMPLLAVSLAADIVLAGVMIRLKTFCLFCVFTYVINLLMFFTALLWYKRMKNQKGASLRETYRKLILKESEAPEKKAVASLYVLFIFLLAFSVFSTSYIMHMKTYAFRQSKEQTQQTVEAFYRQKAENPVLPPSLLATGPASAEVRIVAFTDFLCSACHQFFRLEKELSAKYGDKIAFTYYNYPLDKECNSHVAQTVYQSSCTAARSMLASASLGIFPAYLEKHFLRYSEFHGQYSPDKAAETAAGMSEAKKFQEKAASAAIRQVLLRDIELAEKLNIKATPTLFINGRRMEGAPPREVIEAIIEKELKGTRGQ